MNALCDKLKKMLSAGFFHVMLSNILKNIGAFLSGIILVRLIAKNEYGTYVYANNILSYFMLFSGLGIASAVFQLCCEKKNDSFYAASIFSYGIKWGYIINVVLSFLLLGYALLFANVFENAKYYLLAMSFLPVVNIGYEMISIYYRSRLENDVFSYIVVAYTICGFFTLTCGALFLGVWGIIISNYVTPLVCFFISKKKFAFYNKQNSVLEYKVKKDIWKLAVMSMATNAISNLMYMIDISMITTFMKDEAAIASYKIASTIPSAMIFISSSIITFVYPYFALHIDDVKWTILTAKKLVLGTASLFAILCILMVLYAEWIVTLVFGIQYQDAIYIFQILSVSLFFQGSFRVIIGNLLVAQRAVSFNIIESILTGIVNIVGDYLLIEKYQSAGVAFSTLIVMVFSSTISLMYYSYLLHKKQQV